MEDSREDPKSPSDAPPQPGFHCRRCRYDLSGLAAGHVCPECGVPVLDTPADLLIHADPIYLERLSQGLRMVVLSTMIAIFLIAAQITIGSLYEFGQAPFTGLLLALTWAILAFFFIAGWWLFSIPDPREQIRDAGDGIRAFLRSMLALEAVLVSFILLSLLVVDVDLLTGLCFLLLSGVWMARFLGSMLYIRWIARRTRDTALMSSTRLYTWLLPVIFVLGCVFWFIGPMMTALMYLLFINRVRGVINAIRSEQHASPEPTLPG